MRFPILFVILNSEKVRSDRQKLFLRSQSRFPVSGTQPKQWLQCSFFGISNPVWSTSQVRTIYNTGGYVRNTQEGRFCLLSL